jgi:hypothetical protein
VLQGKDIAERDERVGRRLAHGGERLAQGVGIAHLLRL